MKRGGLEVERPEIKQHPRCVIWGVGSATPGLSFLICEVGATTESAPWAVMRTGRAHAWKAVQHLSGKRTFAGYFRDRDVFISTAVMTYCVQCWGHTRTWELGGVVSCTRDPMSVFMTEGRANP